MRIATRTPRGHLIVATAALLWSLAGLAAFLVQETISPASLPAEQRDLLMNQPAWNVAAYAVAVFAQLAGAVALLMRRRWAAPAFGIAIVAILVQYSYPFLIAHALSIADPAKSAFPALILGLAVALFLYARRAAKAGLLQ